MDRLTTKEFISKSNEVHNFKYDYSMIEYVNCMTKVKIICDMHGLFEQTPLNHMKGHICKKCSSEKVANDQRKGSEFVSNSVMKYGDKYDYSKVVYKNRVTKVIIGCLIHGDYVTTPVNHLNGNGCVECSREQRRVNNCGTFIDKSNIVHKGRYDYSLVVYKTDKIKVSIICEKHGLFKQQPNTHLNGIGCPSCSSSKGELAIMDFLIKHKIDFENEYKFNDCYHINNLSFDFYLPNRNICIEYDGKQHYKAIDFFGGEDGLKLTKLRDNIKDNYCSSNEIKLIRISYKDYKNIDKILNKYLWES